MVTYGYPPEEARKRVAAVFAKEKGATIQAPATEKVGQHPKSQLNAVRNEQKTGGFLAQRRRRASKEK